MINNNIVCTEDELGIEYIYLGRGLGFKKSVGDLIDQENIEKKFRIENEGLYAKFKDLLKEINCQC